MVPSKRKISGDMEKLDFCSVANAASIALANLIATGEANLEPVTRFSECLPYLFSHRPLEELTREQIDTEVMVACADSLESIPRFEVSESVMGVVSQMVNIRKDFQTVGEGILLPIERLKELRTFCLALQDALMKRIPPCGHRRRAVLAIA